MRVGTRTIARDWHWVDRALEEGEDDDIDVAPPRVRRMPEAAIGRRRRGGRRGQGGGDGGSHAAEPSGSAVGQTAGASTQGYVDETQQIFGSPGQSFFEGVLSHASLERQFGADGAYYADLARCLQESPQAAHRGSSSQPPVDLNEPATDLFGDFSFTLGGT
ncbi:hypothetical protein PIB30_025957 [Stylosanthes scabra]|uniref:Uncharacterized protein n=1 Tax=Stylosanthes scabra TaxID=79078 RepID=A0ABU6RAH8_9FABA|nr:hypothetical protein [Stylosanthes scabra]